MISPKTTALIAAMSLLGAVTPAAFAQNTVTATQSNSFTADIAQSSSQSATTGDDSPVTQTSSQGFCLQANQQNAAAGNDATNTGTNAIVGTVDGDDSTGVDCS
jgi:hypothetical protein